MSPHRPTIGIDPGLCGALALLDNGRVRVLDMPLTCDGQVDGRAISAWLSSVLLLHDVRSVWIEKVSSLPRQAGAFNFGFSTGMIHGVLATFSDVQVRTVMPAVWKRRLGLVRFKDEADGAFKTRSRELAMAMWPAQAALFQRVKDDGRAEAALIAYYGSTQ